MQRLTKGGVREVILATNPNLEGESTAAYIQRQIAGKTGRVTRLARGLPIGGDLEYADEVTLTRAIEGRRRCNLRPAGAEPQAGSLRPRTSRNACKNET